MVLQPQHQNQNVPQQDGAPAKKAVCIGGRRVNKKKVKSANRLASRKAARQQKLEDGKQALIEFKNFQTDMEGGKFDEILLNCIRKGSPDASDEALQEALVLQKKEFLSGHVKPEEALKVKSFLEAQLSTASGLSNVNNMD
jgi:hypothetical protein